MVEVKLLKCECMYLIFDVLFTLSSWITGPEQIVQIGINKICDESCHNMFMQLPCQTLLQKSCSYLLF